MNRRQEDRYSVVIPTIGRPSLHQLLAALAGAEGPPPDEVIVVDDRVSAGPMIQPGAFGLPLSVLRSEGRGPAAARNTGWRAVRTPWVAFLDDDVVVGRRWCDELAVDLVGLPWLVAGTQGRLRVPLPTDRRPTDWERNVAGLASARWATADLAYRRGVLEEVGGFDERFPRAFREDSDLGLRLWEAGYLIVQGERHADHPVRPAGRWISVRLQAGNADDVLMRARHGAGWRVGAGAGPGRNGRHLLTSAAFVAASAALAAGKRRAAAIGAAAWLAGTAEFAVGRIRPGPRTRQEVTTMAMTSAVIPVAAVAHQIRGWAALPRLNRDEARAPLGQPRSPLALQPARVWTRGRRRPRSRRLDVAWRPSAVLFDRDGTLVVDAPGNTDPDRVALMPGARVALRRARDEGLMVGVVTNQSAIGRGTMTRQQVDAVNHRIEDLLGPFGTWQICPHAPEDGCDCRKPRPGLIVAAAAALGVRPEHCAVIGDIGSDVEAARAAGARSVLVPTPKTRLTEIDAAAVVAPHIGGALDLVLASMC